MVIARRLLFQKWAINKQDRCYHTMSRDISARPHEISSLEIKDIVFKTADNKQSAEVLVQGILLLEEDVSCADCTNCRAAYREG